MNDFLRKVHPGMGLSIWAIVSIAGWLAFGFGDRAALTCAAGFALGLAYAQLAPWGIPEDPTPEEDPKDPWPGEDEPETARYKAVGEPFRGDSIWEWDNEPEEE